MPVHSVELGREWDRHARNAAVAAHVLAILTGPLGPLFVSLHPRFEHPFVRFHATQATLFGAFGWALAFATCGLALVPFVLMGTYAVAKAACGQWYAHPLLGRIV